LGEDRSDPDGEHGLAQLTLERVLLLEKQGAGELLGDRAAALAMAAQRAQRGAGACGIVDRTMAKEIRIFARDHRVPENAREGPFRQAERAEHLLGGVVAVEEVFDLAGI